jgi:hypothetical protein
MEKVQRLPYYNYDETCRNSYDLNIGGRVNTLAVSLCSIVQLSRVGWIAYRGLVHARL